MARENQKKDEFLEISDLLTNLVEIFENYGETNKIPELEIALLKMENCAQKIGGLVLVEYMKLKTAFEFFKKSKDKKPFLEQCVRLKNELWEI
jgi:hypothetical protein